MPDPLRFMLDVNIYDQIVADNDFCAHLVRLCCDGKIRFITTHIQQEQLAAIPDSRADLKHKIGDFTERAKVEVVGAHGGVWGFLQWGDRWGGGTEKIDVCDVATVWREEDIQDGIIATSADGEGTILVTQGRKLRERARKKLGDSKVLTYAQFKEKILGE